MKFSREPLIITWSMGCTPSRDETLDWLVIGGGPCGTMSVGVLLDRLNARIGWIDQESFESMGRLGMYGTVPANAKNEWLCESFSAIEAFEFHGVDGPCDIQLAVRALADASKAMRDSGRLALVRLCKATCLRFDGDFWNVETTAGVLQAKRVLLAPGGTPRRYQMDFEILEHDDVIIPERCPRVSGRVAVVGGSHSGMLAAKNLVERGADVTVYARRQPIYTEGTKYIGSGLKGQVAAWTRANLGVTFRYRDDAPDEEPGERLAAMFREDHITAVVFTCGFERVQLPRVVYLDNPITIRRHNTRNGRLAPGLHGVGIAFPEYFTDADGFTEARVGYVAHFHEHLHRVIDAAMQPIFKDLTQQLRASASLSFSERPSSASSLSFETPATRRNKARSI